MLMLLIRNLLNLINVSGRKGNEMMQRKKVHVTDINGKLLYTRLWDDGSNVLQFDGASFGFIDRLDAIRYRWQIKDGWKRTSIDIAK